MEQLTLTNIVLSFAFLLNVGLGLLVYLNKSTHRRVNISFSIFSWASASWILSVLMFFLFKDQIWKLFWARMSFVGPSIIPAAFFYFSGIFPRKKDDVTPSKIIILSILSSIFVILSFTGLMVRSANWERLTLNYGIAHKYFSIYFILLMSAGIFYLIKSYKNSIGLEHIQIKYCFFGIFLTFIPSITLNLILPLLGTSRYSHLGPSSTLIMVSFFTYAILKHRLMDINIVLKKGTTYILLMLLLFIPSILLIILSQKLFFKEINYLFSAIILSLLLLVAFFFHQIKPGTEKAVEYFLFKNKYDYRETLGKFSKAMVSILDLQSLSKRIIDTIAQTMGVEKASLFLMNEEKGGYFLQESRNIKMASQTPLLPKGDPLPCYLQKIGEIIVREELIKGVNLPELESVIEQMGLLGAEVSIPLISKGQLIGMINLSQKFDKDIYYHEDIELLSTLANQTTIAIENANLYEDLKKSKSYMRRTDRLASLGTLTAGLAHEIRNPLVAIKTFTQLLPERLEDEEFRSHFLNIASSEVDRISSLITELLEFARPSDPKMEFEDINSILDGMILLVSTETKKKQINIVKNYITNLPPIKIDREQIKQVFLNFLLNSIEATPERGEMTVKTRSFVKPGGEPYIQIEFTDNGRGIPAEHLEDIFTPFFTTKDKGSGLGLSISHQIVQDHRGYIDVESELNKGTSFFINLPLNQEYPKRRSEDLRNHQDIFNSFER
ncbi:MAG: ATP-binding protein [Thermodesulfobacteriota bacterium]